MNEQPVSQPTSPNTSINTDSVQRTNKLKLVWGIVCLTAPTVLLIISILGYALFNFLASTTSATPTGAETLVADPKPAWQTISNVLLFAIGCVSVLTWLPGIITGIILLSTRKQV